ncbi:uncharacterized protein LOC129777413 [Toxorhynchites rutilus septentrionalis]|uniref:uncharacterized protein LOC129777413 n=1 Tax=Toxorhynchites rutilus septentrionalis TaxID=329112 RepID=UPI0024790BF4|nr:uncharacterized protein LOC129777413 [Toxorhynchites rutilus septentrionalis]
MENKKSSSSSRNGISLLLKEQRQLNATEAKLKSMINKINNQLNQLLVEELQLKSRELDQKFPQDSYTDERTSVKQETAATSAEINQQELNLNIQCGKLLKSLEESEEDD